MAGPLLYDRVCETSTTTGTGAFTLLGAKVGYRSFDDALAVGDTFPYCIANQGGTEWEVGIATLSASTTLTRTTVLSSSNSGSAVDFSAGTKDVFLCYPAARAVLKAGPLGSARLPYVNANGELTDSADMAFTGGAVVVTDSSPVLNSACRGAFIGTTINTSSVVQAFVVGLNSTGTPATGFGVRFEFFAESSTTVNRTIADITASWNVATDASRASDLRFHAYYIATAQEGIRIRGASGGVQIGFFGATPVGQQNTTGTTAGHTAGSSTAVRQDSTFTGNTGSTAYTVGDIVLALKNLGFLAL